MQNPVDLLIQQVTFFARLKIFNMQFCIDWLFWLVNLSIDNIEIILHVQNPVDPLIQLVTFFASLKISTCVCQLSVDLLIWLVTFSRENIEIILYV